MKIAIFGATSEIAKDLIISFSVNSNHDLVLFARRPEEVFAWMKTQSFPSKYEVLNFDSFINTCDLEVIINFVGAGDPSKINDIGSSIFDVTSYFDNLAINYLKSNPTCRYIFISSGAAYGIDFLEPASINKEALVPINGIGARDWYGVSKIQAECRHRAYSHLAIIDVRVFNYFSCNQNMSTNFFIAEVISAISKNEKLYTSPSSMTRDYIGREDFFVMISCLLDSDFFNGSVDCYSKGPIEKFRLINLMVEKFGLRYEISEKKSNTQILDLKKNYFSINHHASKYGYQPLYSSAELIIEEAMNYFGRNKIECL